MLHKGVSPGNGPLTGLQGTRFFCTVPTQSGGKTRVLAVRNNAVRRLPKGNLIRIIVLLCATNK